MNWDPPAFLRIVPAPGDGFKSNRSLRKGGCTLSTHLHQGIAIVAKRSAGVVTPFPGLAQRYLRVPPKREPLFLAPVAILEPLRFEAVLGDEEVEAARISQLVVSDAGSRFPGFQISEHRCPHLIPLVPSKCPQKGRDWMVQHGTP